MSEIMSALDEAKIYKVAEGITYFSKLQKEFECIYASDNLRFYNKVRESSILKSNLCKMVRMEMEASIRHDLGILLAALDCDELMQKVCIILMSADPRMKDYITHKNSGDSLIEYVTSQTALNLECKKSRYICHFITYIVDYNPVFASCTDLDLYQKGQAQVQTALNISDIIMHNSSGSFDIEEILQDLKLSKNSWKVIRKIVNTETISAIQADKTHFWNGDMDTPQYPELVNLLNENDLVKIYATVSSCYEAMTCAGISWPDMFTGLSISKEEQARLLCCMQPYAALDEKCKPYQYFTVFMFYILSREIQTIREYHWANCEEVKQLESNYLEQENNALRDKNQSIQRQIEQLNAQLAQKNKTDQAQFHESESGLRQERDLLAARVRELEKSLENYEDDLQELEDLRELVTAEPKTVVDRDPYQELLKLSGQKSIVVIGGHIHWRNKLKAAYPEIRILDGTASDVDLKVLENADIVLMYTYNMAHKISKKVMNYTRQHHIRVSYIPYAINEELLTIQMLDVLQKNLSM